MIEHVARPDWDRANHPFQPQGNGIYCEICGGSRAGAQHTHE